MTNQTIQTLAVATLTWLDTNYVKIGTVQNHHGRQAFVCNGHVATNTEYVIALPDGSEVRHRQTNQGPLVAPYRLFPIVDGPEIPFDSFWSLPAVPPRVTVPPTPGTGRATTR